MNLSLAGMHSPPCWLLVGSAPLGDEDAGLCSAKGTVISVVRGWCRGKEELRPKAGAIWRLLAAGLGGGGKPEPFQTSIPAPWRAQAAPHPHL